MLLLRAYSTFSETFGLKMNAQKSSVYINGVNAQLKKDILSISGFIDGTLPFKYLGVPITAGRLMKKDVALLIDKIVARIKSLGAKHLSYAGRLVLVSSVLSTMHSYWAAMFVLAKSVLKRVDDICRNFLWEGNLEYGKAPSVAWHKPDRLWVQWVNHVYLKDSSWLQYNPPSDCCWYWRKICSVKDTISGGFVEGKWCQNSGMYTMKSCYQWLRLKRDQVDWYRAV
ncbi:uncharacterized protein LOC141628740 [Silene latifolia]|uniref:uncharacterized protein LOC141628740 n=1 Tax=Silene latifolia TaxID=37657 RepID=UPI003D76DB32